MSSGDANAGPSGFLGLDQHRWGGIFQGLQNAFLCPQARGQVKLAPRPSKASQIWRDE